MNKLSISVDMGAKNNGVFIIKTNKEKILDKKANCIIINKGTINFSKKSRRENRHKDRNYKRRKLAKRLLKEFIDFSKYDEKQQEFILGLLNNRGYTFISTSTEFEKLNDTTVKFITKYFEEINGLISKEDFEDKISSFEEIKDLKEYILEINDKISFETKKKKLEFYKEFQLSFKTIKDDLQDIKKLFLSILNEIETGSKPRIKYFDDIKEEINQCFGFLKNYSKEEFFNLVANISNLQLRVLRKYFNQKFDDKLDIQKLDSKIRGYFKAFHYKSDKEKAQRKELFDILNNESDMKTFLITSNPSLTIPPYEDMNNRDTYKCNSMLIKPELLNDDLKNSIDSLLRSDYFSNLLIGSDGEFIKEELIKIKPSSNNTYIKTDFTYSKYLQRILDIKIEDDNKIYHPRVVFKNKNPKAIELFKKLFGVKLYDSLKPLAKNYYEEEPKIHNGIYESSTSLFEKCNTNTSYKNNVKELLLKPLYSYNFTDIQTKEFINKIENYEEKINGTTLLRFLKFVEGEYKKYQNSFYHIVGHNFELENKKDIKDNDIKKLLDGLNPCVIALKNILNELNIKTYFDDVKTINKDNLSRILNILKQTYNILFYDLSGFSKTCKNCTKENAIRSDENFTIGKRLLSDVAKPIDGMLDMMLDRLAFEITEQINEDDIKDINNLEILLEQNRFEFEGNLNDIKRANDPTIKKYKNDKKYMCPYLGVAFDKGEYDHILPQSKEVYNSKANMIHCSPQGNKEKSNKIYKLENLNIKHLKEVFSFDDITKIKEFISTYIKTINEKDFKNFDNLNLNQQKAFRYALFMENNTDEYKKAFNLVKLDKLKTFSNGTQKRLARFIYEKLVKKYPDSFKDNKISVDSKTINNMLVSATRKSLSTINEVLKKEKYQESHSHCIDAMIVFCLANAKISGRADKKKDNLTTMMPTYDFGDIYLEESGINNLSKKVTFINSPKKEIGSVTLFQGTIYSEHYFNIIQKEDKYFANNKILKLESINTLIQYQLLYKNIKGKKHYFNSIEMIKLSDICKIDIKKTSDLIYRLFNDKNKLQLNTFKFLDMLRYSTSKSEIESIFFDLKQTKLLDFAEIKKIPQGSENLYKSVYKKLKNEPKLFDVKDEKRTLSRVVLNELLKNIFETKQKTNKETAKRDKKRHKYTLPMVGQNAKYRIKREKHWQILGGENIATKNYIVGDTIKAIPFFTKNTMPLKISDLTDCLLINKETESINDVPITKIDEINDYISSLKYLVNTADRCAVIVTFRKNNFKDIDFNTIKSFDGGKDDVFKQLIEKYIDNKELEISKYIGSIRDGIKAKAILLDNNSNTMTIQYNARITANKKKIILDNIK